MLEQSTNRKGSVNKANASGNNRSFKGPGGAFALGCMVLVTLVLSMVSCNGGGEGRVHTASDLAPEAAARFDELTTEELSPFNAEDLDPITKNSLHISHAENRVACAKCHESRDPLGIKETAGLCHQCHPDVAPVEIIQDVWLEHCFACHFFDGTDLENEGRVPQKPDCQTCHTPETAGEDIYGFFSHRVKSMLACKSCHRPHSDPPVFATTNCASCHGVFLDNEFVKAGHRSCSLCHEPHYWTPAEDLDCTACHSAPSTVLPHRIGTHPLDDCLACHNPHFNDKDIAGGSCQLCHDDKVYITSSNPPVPHRTCENCHNLADFSFKGFSNCTTCHTDRAEMLTDESVPAAHKNCASCHQPHTWTGSFNNCKNCHDLSSVLEHRFEFHPKECSICHDPHTPGSPPPSGSCNVCHGEGTFPEFSKTSPAQHLTCANCHEVSSIEDLSFQFIGREDTCQICHADPPEEDLSWDDVPSGHVMCEACHQPHTWAPQYGEGTCGLCHSDVTSATAGNEMHTDCSSCHLPGHEMEFAGVDMSCAFCHYEQLEQATSMGKEDCFMCHSQHEFGVDNTVCAICHAEEAETAISIGKDQCSTCHNSHTFRADTSTCNVCHTEIASQVGKLGKDDCTICHDTSGHGFKADTGTCGVCHAIQYEEASQLGKTDCMWCHSVHDFKADTGACSTCHPEPPATHRASGHKDCMNCHSGHNFKPDRTTCTLCHTDRADHHPEIQDCTRCHIFYTYK